VSSTPADPDHRAHPDAVVEWFDSHCHLQTEYLAGDQGKEPDQPGAHAEPHASRLAGAIARASEAGVTRMVCVGTDAATSAEAVELARAMARADSVATAEGIQMWATIGLHPHDAINGVLTLDSILAAELPDPRGGSATDKSSTIVVGIGECGLDYHYDHSPRDVQRAAFAAQIELALGHRLTLVVHTREAWDDTIDILAATGVGLAPGIFFGPGSEGYLRACVCRAPDVLSEAMGRLGPALS